MWTIKTFEELTTKELFIIYKERVKIFIVEQDCPYQDIDELDLTSLHVFKTDEDGVLLAYGRIISQDSRIHFGRIIVAKEQRGTGLGKELLTIILDHIAKQFPTREVEIQAQAYLEKFYGSFGFVPISEEYLEDNIPHIDMLLQK
ncbi:GNAT family N-acetyltransferase [Carnobacterium gallinarum]|uniref:GNAT family N-acetyltransferase n=1 Tax=Carnobacterium gallinarum TaxID=2749 RepID=UPI0005504CEE|nr:GNAT family N-acetyltransferase [Carnobacterium gallinarum]